MRILLDTNVLCRFAEKGHAFHSAAEHAVLKMRDEGHELCLVPQVLYEYWVVATRPVTENGLDMQPADFDKAIGMWLDLFTLFRDERGIFAAWREVVRHHNVKGKVAHDARLVAAMMRHGLEHLLTFNVGDFQRYAKIEVLDAQLIAAS